MTNEQARTDLQNSLSRFIRQRCWYSDQEREAVEKAINMVQEIDEHCEAINAKHPEHGQPVLEFDEQLW